MIRHHISDAALLALIDAEDADWRTDAKDLAAEIKLTGRKVADEDGIWSRIKGVFMALQGYKCMYCELPMPMPSPRGVSRGLGVYDVEHFRPKNRVVPWPSKAVSEARHIDYASKLKSGFSKGYVWLAFDPFNYGVSCKVCNSELKRDRFPILGEASTAQTRAVLDAEEVPCLIHPIGELGLDPETWFEWTGPIVRPAATLKSADALRARTIIDFFELDTRADLLLLRSMLITLLARFIADTSANGRASVEQMCAATKPFAGCARAFVALAKKSPKEAKRWVDRCADYVATQNPSLLEGS